MARRDRQKRRRGKSPGPHVNGPHRDNVPGSLDHASGDVDEFEAGIVSGAAGVPADDDGSTEAAEQAAEDEAELAAEEELAAEAVVADTAARRAVGTSGAPTAHQAVTSHGGNRVFGFLRACWAELQRVQWPDRRQVGQATAVVLGFVVIAGAYLGLADVVAQKIINFIL